MENSTGTCPVCGTTLPPRKPGPGRPRLYCSPTCGKRDRARLKPVAPSRRKERGSRICAHCGEQFFLTRKERQYCSIACSQAARVLYEPRSCKACGTSYRRTGVTVYCSRECQHLDMMITASDKGCSVAGCNNKHRARGLCATHYNQQHQPERHRKRLVPCSACGVMVEKATHNGRSPVCSEECRYVISWGRTKQERDAKREAERRSHMQLVGPVRFEKTTTAPTTTIKSTLPYLVSAECRECGRMFIDHVQGRGGTIALTCSDTCRRRWARRKRRFVTTKVRNDIYARDNWTCQLCQTPVTSDYNPGDMWSASLDHIIPQSHGGGHDPSNLRLAHRYCNAIRSDAKISDGWFISPGA